MLADAVSIVFILAALIGGSLFTVRLRFFQFRWFFPVIKKAVLALLKREDGVSSFKASSTALAGAIGVGNITGVGTAIALGGAGAIFWMWASALLLMSVKYAEIYLGVRHRRILPDGSAVGGPMYYLSYGAGKNALAAIYACVCIITAFLMGNMIQSNAIAMNMHQTWGISPLISGAAVSVLTGMVLLGGVKRITSVCSLIVPVFAAVYIVGCIFVIAVNIKNVPNAFAQIITGAFSPRAVAGGGAWLALRYGLARGVFTNEAGTGSSSIIHAETDNRDIQAESLTGVFEVFLDTIVICTLTALAILCSGITVPGGELSASAAFEGTMPGFGRIIIAVSVFFFAYATIIGWSFFGQRAMGYLSPNINSRLSSLPFVFAPLIGAAVNAPLLWAAADVTNAVMLCVNMAGLILLKDQVRFSRKLL